MDFTKDYEMHNFLHKECKIIIKKQCVEKGLVTHVYDEGAILADIPFLTLQLIRYGAKKHGMPVDMYMMMLCDMLDININNVFEGGDEDDE